MSATFAEAWTMASTVDGWLTEAQGRALFEAGRRLLPGTTAVEIGSHRGKSAVLIASGLPAGGRLVAVDPFDTNIARAGLTDRIDLFRGISIEASSTWSGGPVGFCWVDGAHDFESTLADFDGWLPHIAEGGEFYVHDAFSAIGTTKAVLRRFLWSSTVRYTGCERTLVKFTVGRTTFSQRVVSAAGLLRRLPFFTRMLAIKLARRRGHKRLEGWLMTRPNEPLI